MNPADVMADQTLEDVLRLSGLAWLAAQRAANAREAADALATLPELSAAAAPLGLRADVSLIARATIAADRAATLTQAASTRATSALGAAVASIASGDDFARLAACRRIERAIRSTSTSLAKTYRQAALAGWAGAGIAAMVEFHGDRDELLEVAAREALLAVPIAEAGNAVGIEVGRDERVLMLVAGFLGHAALHQPAFVIIAPADNAASRYVRATIDGVHRVESAADAFLPPCGQLTADELAALAELGFAAPDVDELSWWLDTDGSTPEVAALLLRTLRRVHGVDDGDTIVLSIALAADHPSCTPVSDPSVLVVAGGEPTVDAVAASLAARLRDGIATVGLDGLWVTVGQEGLPYVAHLGSNFDGQLFTEVTGDFYLDDDERLDESQRARLRALGWDDPVDDDSDDEEIQPRNHTRVWPSPVDVDAAAWHVVLTLNAVYGLDVTEPWIGTTEPI